MAAQDIISTLPQSRELATNHGFEYKCRPAQGGGAVEMFFKVPPQDSVAFLAELEAAGVQARQAIRKGQVVADNVYTFSDFDGSRSRIFIETLARQYPEAQFELPPMENNQQFLWLDNRERNCYMDLLFQDGRPMLVLTSPLHVEDLSEEKLRILREREGFASVPNLPGLFSDSNVSMTRDGLVRLPLGRMMNFLGRDTVLTPMNYAQASGNEPLPPRSMNEHALQKEQTRLLGVAQNLLRIGFSEQASQLDLGRLDRALATDVYSKKSQWTSHVQPGLEFDHMSANADALKVLAKLPAETAEPMLGVFGLALDSEVWERYTQEDKEALIGHIAEILKLGSPDGDIGKARAATRVLAEYFTNPGYPEDQWQECLFDRNGEPRDDNHAAMLLNSITTKRWDGWWSSLGASLAVVNNIELPPDHGARVLMRQYVEDPAEYVSMAIVEEDPSLLTDFAISRNEALMRQRAAEQIANRSGINRQAASEASQAEAASEQVQKRQDQDAASPPAFESSLNLDDLLGDPTYEDKVEQWDQEQTQDEPRWVEDDQDGSLILANYDSTRWLIANTEEGQVRDEVASFIWIGEQDGAGEALTLTREEAFRYIQEGVLPTAKQQSNLEADQSNPATEALDAAMEPEPTIVSTDNETEAAEQSPVEDGLDFSALDGLEEEDDLAALVSPAEEAESNENIPEQANREPVSPNLSGFAAEVMRDIKKQQDDQIVDTIRQSTNPNKAGLEQPEEPSPERVEPLAESDQASNEPSAVLDTVEDAAERSDPEQQESPDQSEPETISVMPVFRQVEIDQTLAQAEAEPAPEANAASDDTTERDEYESFKAYLDSATRAEVIDQNVIGKALAHRFGAQLDSSYDDLVDRANYLASVAMPTEREIEDRIDVASVKTAEFLSVVDAIADRPFNQQSLNELAFERPAETAYQAGLLVALMKAAEGHSALIGNTNYDIRVVDQADALQAGMARVSELLGRMKWSSQELDQIVAKLPLVERKSTTAVVKVLTERNQFERLAQLGQRAISNATGECAQIIAQALESVPEQSPAHAMSFEMAERLSDTHGLDEQAEPVGFRDEFLADVVAAAREQLADDVRTFTLNTGYKQRYDLPPLQVQLNGSDASVSVMVVDFDGDETGQFHPMARYDFERGELAGLTLVTGGESSRRTLGEAQALWASLKTQYDFLEQKLVSKGVPAPIAIDTLLQEFSETEDDEFDMGMEWESHEDDQDRDADLDVDADEFEAGAEPVSWLEQIEDREDKELLGHNRQGQAVFYAEMDEPVEGRSNFRFVDVDGELVPHTSPELSPADALLMPSGTELGSAEYKGWLVAMLEAQLKRPEVIKGEKTFTWGEWMDLAATVSTLHDSPTVGPIRGETGLQDQQWQAMVEEATESVLNRTVATLIGDARGRDDLAAEQDTASSKQMRFATNLFNAVPGRRMRTSEQRQLQQFSTPIAASVAMGELLREHLKLIEHQGAPTILEPTAGTGGLLVNMPSNARVVANEMSNSRYELLAHSLHGLYDTTPKIIKGNALKQEFVAHSPDGELYDAMVINPPFGSTESPIHCDASFQTTRLDWGLAIKGLDSIKDNGLGFIIVGGDSKFDSEKGKLNGSSQKALNYIQDNFNVVNAAHVELSEYAKNGAAWPLTVVVVQGRFPTPEADRIDVAEPLPQFMSAEGICAFVDDSRRLLSDTPTLEVLREKGLTERAEREKRQEENRLNSAKLIGGFKARRHSDRQPESSEARTEQTSEQVETQDESLKKPSSRGEGSPPDADTRPSQGVQASNAPEPVTGQAPAESLTADSQESESKEEQEVEEGPLRYKARAGLGRTDLGGVVISKAMNEGVQQAFDYIEKRYGTAENLLTYCLDWPAEKISSTFTDYQCDGLALMFTSFDLGHEFLNQMGTGTGKGIFQAGLLRFTAVMNDRLEQGLLTPEDFGLPEGTNRLPAMFVCEKSGMFQDFYWRDLGMLGDELRDRFYPVIINSDGKVYSISESGTRDKLIARHRPADWSKVVDAQSFDAIVPPGKIPLLMTTYSQFQSPKSYVKRDTVRSLMQGGVLLADEAHNAAGEDSNIGHFIDKIKSTTRFQLSSSATAIKRLGQVSAYRGIFPKSLNMEPVIDANMGDPYALLEMLTTGAAQLGTVFSVSKDMSEVGFSLSPPSEELKQRNIEMADRFALALQELGKFSGEVNGTLDEMTRYYQAVNDTREQLPEGSPTSLVSTNFGSLNHQLCKLYTLLMNLEESVDHAVESVKSGERVVLTMENTCEAIIKHYVSELATAQSIVATADLDTREALMEKNKMSLDQAEAVLDGVDVSSNGFVIPREMDARDAIHRVLERMLWVTERRSRTDSVKRNVFEIALENAERQARNDYEPDMVQTLDEFVEARQKEAVDNLNHFLDGIREKIDAIGPGLPLSPMDYLNDRLKAEGIKCGELSARETYCRVRDGKTFLGTMAKRDRNAIVDAFNNLPTDDANAVEVVLLTRAGASGISLHDSENNAMKSPRRMVVVQMSDDVNVFLQTIGRVNRAGQVSSPHIDIRMTGLLFSNKSYISMMKKLASSGAATRGDRKGAMSEMDGPDMFNSVGDVAALDLLVNNPDILELFATSGCKSAARLAEALEKENDALDLSDYAAGMAKDIVAYSSIMTNDQGLRVKTELESRFEEIYASMSRLGTNPLEAKQLGQATILSETSVHEGAEQLPDGRLDPTDGTVKEVLVSVKQKLRAVPVDVINRAIEHGGQHLKDNQLVRTLSNEERANPCKAMAEKIEGRKSFYLSRHVRKEDIEGAFKELKAEGIAENADEMMLRERAIAVGLKAEAPQLMRAEQSLEYMIEALKRSREGNIVYVDSSVDENVQVPAAIVDVIPPDDWATLASPSAWRMRLVVLGEGASIQTLSSLQSGHAFFTGMSMDEAELRSKFENQESREVERTKVGLAGPIVASISNFGEVVGNSTIAMAEVDGKLTRLMILPESAGEESLPSRMKVQLGDISLMERYVQHQLDENGVFYTDNYHSDKITDKMEKSKVVLKGDNRGFLLVVPGTVDFKSLYTNKTLVDFSTTNGFAGSKDTMSARYSWDALQPVLRTLNSEHVRFYGRSADRDWLNQARQQLKEERMSLGRAMATTSVLGVPMAGEPKYIPTGQGQVIQMPSARNEAQPEMAMAADNAAGAEGTSRSHREKANEVLRQMEEEASREPEHLDLFSTPATRGR